MLPIVVVVVVVVVTRLLLWDGPMEPQKQGSFPGPGPEVIEKQRVAKERAAQRVRSWTVQNEMRGVIS